MGCCTPSRFVITGFMIDCTPDPPWGSALSRWWVDYFRRSSSTGQLYSICLNNSVWCGVICKGNYSVSWKAKIHKGKWLKHRTRSLKYNNQKTKTSLWARYAALARPLDQWAHYKTEALGIGPAKNSTHPCKK